MKKLAFLMLAAGALWADDADGKWTCGLKGSDGVEHPLMVTLKTDDTDLAGTVSGFYGKADIKISDGMNHGDMVMWSTERTIQNANVQFDYKGLISGNEMKITVVRADGKGAAMTCTAKKAK